MPALSTLNARKKRAQAGPTTSTMPERFLSLRDILDRLTISRALLYELIKDPVRPFPAPVHIGRRSVWIEAEVDAYMRRVIEQERALPDAIDGR